RPKCRVAHEGVDVGTEVELRQRELLAAGEPAVQVISDASVRRRAAHRGGEPLDGIGEAGGPFRILRLRRRTELKDRRENRRELGRLRRGGIDRAVGEIRDANESDVSARVLPFDGLPWKEDTKDLPRTGSSAVAVGGDADRLCLDVCRGERGHEKSARQEAGALNSSHPHREREYCRERSRL